MKKILFSTASLFAYGMPALALAQVDEGLNKFAETTNLGTNVDVITAIAKIINVLLGFLGVLAVILILMAGFKWMTSGGNEEKIAEAKKLMGAGVVGLVIILAAYAIAAFVLGQLGTATGYNY